MVGVKFSRHSLSVNSIKVHTYESAYYQRQWARILHVLGSESVMSKTSRSDFHRDIEMRQRNAVFPDTVRNETRMWRNLKTSKDPLSLLQLVGLSVMLLCLVGVMAELAFLQFRGTPGNGLSRVWAGLGGYFILLGLFGAAFLLVRWRVRKALAAARRGPHLGK